MLFWWLLQTFFIGICGVIGNYIGVNELSHSVCLNFIGWQC